MSYTDSEPVAARGAQPTAIKILIAGGFGAGKTTLVGTVSEIRPFRTEEALTSVGYGVDDLSGVPGKHTTTVAMDFGRLTLYDDLALYIFGTPGQYTAQHLSGELLARMAGIRMNAVPYRGSGPAVTDLLGGQIGVAVVDLTSAYPHIKTGDLVALGTTGARRSAVAPELPTIAEGGVAGYDAPAWMGLFAPAGIPPAVADKVSAAVKSALAQPDVRKRLINLAAEPDYMGPQDFSHFIARESNRWEQLLKSINQR